MDEQELKRIKDAAFEEGYQKGLGDVRYAIELKHMGLSDCQIIKKLGIPPAFLHEILEWAK